VDAYIERNTGRLARAIGVVAAGSVCCLAAYSAVGGPFGTINDAGNAVTGMLSAALAWRLRSELPGKAGSLAVGSGVAGGAVAAIGSGLVMSGATSWFLAGLVSSVGFAGIGAFVAALNRQGTGGVTEWPPRLRSVGVLAGSVMLVGIASLPGIRFRLDDAATAPWWAWIGSCGWLGTYILYPAWAWWMGSLESRRARSAGSLAELEAHRA
jgi:hypothetical protein